MVSGVAHHAGNGTRTLHRGCRLPRGEDPINAQPNQGIECFEYISTDINRSVEGDVERAGFLEQ